MFSSRKMIHLVRKSSGCSQTISLLATIFNSPEFTAEIVFNISYTCDSIAFCFRWFFFCEQPSQPLQVQFPRFSHKKIKHRRHRRKDFGLQSRWSQTISERDAAVSVYAKHNLVNNVFASTTTGFSRLLIFCRFSEEKIHQNFWQYLGVKKVLRQTKKIPLLTRGRVNFISGSIICFILSARITRPRITKFNYEI